MAFAVAATTVGYVLVAQLLYQDLPFREPERLAVISAPLDVSRRLSMADLADERARIDESPLIESQAYVRFGPFGDQNGPAPGLTELVHYEVSANFFELLGVSQFLGHGFDRDAVGVQPQQAIIGYELWRSQFGGDPGILERVVTVGAGRARVVGVMPRGFAFPVGANVWTSRAAPAASPPSLVRLKPSTTVQQLASAFPRLNVYGPERLVRPTDSSFLWLVLGATGLLCAVSSLQLAGLTMTRVVLSAEQFWIRRSLGASGPRLLAELIAELAVVVVLGVASAWLLLPASIAFISSWLPFSVTRGQTLTVDTSAVVFSVLVAAAMSLGGLLIGFRLASQISRRAYGTALVSNVAVRRLSGWLSIAQLVPTLALVYLVGLSIVSAERLARVDLGFRPQHLLLARVPASLELPPPVWSTVLADAHTRIGQVPGVVRVARSMSFPLARGAFRGTALLPHDPAFPRTTVRINYVTRDYFQTIGATFTSGEGFSSPFNTTEMVVNSSMARLMSGYGPVVGQPVQVTSQRSTVTGVVEDVVDGSPAVEPDPQVYMLDPGWLARTFQIQVAGDIKTIIPAVRQILAQSSGSEEVSVAPYEDYVTLATAQYRLQMIALVCVGCAALLVAAMGIAAALRLWIRQHTREFGLRIALGADSRAIRQLILRRLLVIVAVTCVLGGGLALVAAHALRAAMFGVTAMDVPVMTMTLAVVFLAVLAAATGPLVRAARIQPTVALRLL